MREISRLVIKVRNEETPLFFAATAEIITALVKAGADVNTYSK